MADENVKVAVRVRPFNQREKDAKAELVVEMVGNQTILKKNKSNEQPRKFAFDFSYWSHDSFRTESNGYLAPEGSQYADQKKVFNDLGVGVLNNAWAGFNASLFAYGQTGSGKSYSVVGYGTNKGIVPLACEDIFKRIGQNKNPGTQFEVSFSMLEIYSEVVRDLLAAGGGDKKAGLLIREDPKNGFYPQGLRKQLVGNYEDITKLIDQGNAVRTIAATNMNATSSRAHTIITITFVQKYVNEGGKEMAKTSVINLVDLAGSERADQTGATGDRLKEGAAINLSLTSLGNVISALAENSSGKNVRIPYRDSVLTKLLMNALGGNSKTIMIAAISPADINFDESLSTLRYADRAKQIKTKAVVNEDPTEKLIRSLQEENAKLKELLSKGGKIDPSMLSGTPSANSDASEALKKALAENEKQMKEMQMTYEEKLSMAHKTALDSKTSKIFEEAKSTLHLTNINMDPSLSNTIKHLLKGNGEKLLGNGEKVDIRLNGLGILEAHAKFIVNGASVKIEPIGQSKIIRNGKQIVGPTDLTHLDRFVFGASQYYQFIDPTKKSSKDPQYTFEMFQDEIAKENGLFTNNKNMTKEELQCQGELIDLLPKIEEANQISIIMDKKVKFEVVIVSPEARGEYDGKVRPFVKLLDFVSGLEWIWTREKFLHRQVLMSEYYADFKDDGIINRDKFKNFDPFNESPDTPTQLGTIVLFPKASAFNVPTKGDFKVTDLFGKQTGVANIEILPCDKTGKILTEADGVIIRDPQKDLLNKMVHFVLKINKITGLNDKYEDIYCQFNLYKDKTTHKTETIRGTNNPEFKFSKQFDNLVTNEFLDFIMNKCLYIQVWAEQKHPKVDSAKVKITTKEYFERASKSNSINFDKKVDPEAQKLRDELNLVTMREKQVQVALANIRKLSEQARLTNKRNVPAQVLKELLDSQTQAQADKIIQNYANSKEAPMENSPKVAEIPQQKVPVQQEVVRPQQVHVKEEEKSSKQSDAPF